MFRFFSSFQITNEVMKGDNCIFSKVWCLSKSGFRKKFLQTWFETFKSGTEIVKKLIFLEKNSLSENLFSSKFPNMKSTPYLCVNFYLNNAFKND